MSRQNLSRTYEAAEFQIIKLSILRLQTTENDAKYL